MHKLLLIVTLFLMVPTPASAEDASEEHGSRFAIGLNVLQLGLFGIASAAIPDGSVVPIPIEIHAQGAFPIGLASTIQIRSIDDHGAHRGEFTGSVGPRFRIVGQDLQGLYGTVKFGLSGSNGVDIHGDDYENVAFVIHPEFGGAVTLGRPGLFMAFAGGVRIRAMIVNRPKPDWNVLGELMNLYVPVFNVTVGFAI